MKGHQSFEIVKQGDSPRVSKAVGIADQFVHIDITTLCFVF